METRFYQNFGLFPRVSIVCSGIILPIKMVTPRFVPQEQKFTLPLLVSFASDLVKQHLFLGFVPPSIDVEFIASKFFGVTEL